MLAQGAQSRSEFAGFLKYLRQRVDCDISHLGPYPRLAARLGKRVTQEELAEAIGVTREWYAVLETATRMHASTALLGRLADALMLMPDERTTLLQFALPELGPLKLRDDSRAVLEAFSRLRSLSKRLWVATSVDEALRTASEEIATWFADAALVHTSHRRKSGLWESLVLDDRQERNKALLLIRELEDELLPTSEAIDALKLYPQLSNAGDVGTPDLQPPPVQHEVKKIFARRRLAGFTFIKARVRSRTGLIGSICTVHDDIGHVYSASDRAVLGAFSELVSLTLS